MSDQRWIIPESVFVGLPKNPRGVAPLSHMTAAGTDAGAKGRMQTVINHSKSTLTLPNTPQWGITLSGSSWKDEIRVDDPRGFSVSVSLDAMLHMMKECAVVNGVIQAACVWARSDGKNVLLAVGSDTHDLAQLQTRLAHSKVSLKNVQLGDWVTLNNGVQGVYLGKYHTLWVNCDTWIRSHNVNKLQVHDTVRTVIWQPHMKRSWSPSRTQCVMFMSNPVVAEHESHDQVYTDAQAELKVNQLLQDATCDVHRTSRSYYTERVLAASRKPMHVDHIKITSEPVTYAHANEVNNLDHKVHWSPDGEKFWMLSGTNRQTEVNVYEWDSVSLKQNQLKLVPVASHNSSARYRTLDQRTALNDLYVFKVTYTTALGNQLMAII